MRTNVQRLLGAAALGAILAATPIAPGFDGAAFSLNAAKALAKDGGGGSDDSGSSGSSHGGSSGSSGSDGGSSGSGSSGDGHGGSSRGSDDHGGSSGSGGSGGGSDDHGGSGGNGRGGADDAGGDDHRGGATPSTGGATRSSGSPLRVVDFEQTATGVEVTYSNGLREEIANGRFEQKDASGRTLIERPVTQADLARIARNTGRSGIVAVPIGTQVTRVEARAGSIEVTYGTGWREEIAAGRYELKDPNDNTVIQRAATPADVSRLRALAGG